MTTRPFFFLFVSLAACSVSLHHVTPGEKKQATFEYGYCLFDCTVDRPMMHGTSESIFVQAKTLPDLTASSTMPGVVTVTNPNPQRQCCSTSGSSESCRSIQPGDTCNVDEMTSLAVAVVATGPGGAELLLTQSDGTIFDQVHLDVAEPASLALSCGGEGSTTLANGKECAVSWKAFDASGAELFTTEGVQLTTSDASIVDFKRTFLSFSSSTVDATQVLFGTTIDAHAPGDAVVTAKAASVTTTFSVHVTP